MGGDPKGVRTGQGGFTEDSGIGTEHGGNPWKIGPDEIARGATGWSWRNPCHTNWWQCPRKVEIRVEVTVIEIAFGKLGWSVVSSCRPLRESIQIRN